MRILQRVYKDMRIKGFQGLRADRVIETMDVTKGALYYHFKNKTLLGYAILEEVIQPEYLKPYLPLLEYEGNPISFLQSILSGIKLTTEAADLQLGDPVHNLALEMSPLDEGFRKRLEIMQDSVKDIISDALYRGQVRGFVSEKAKPVKIA
ncbi:MAG: TetR/AcrR family transcriptional regulator, partial [Bacteroidota bacterium]